MMCCWEVMQIFLENVTKIKGNCFVIGCSGRIQQVLLRDSAWESTRPVCWRVAACQKKKGTPTKIYMIKLQLKISQLRSFELLVRMPSECVRSWEVFRVYPTGGRSWCRRRTCWEDCLRQKNLATSFEKNVRTKWQIIQNCWLVVKARLVVRLTVWPHRRYEFAFWHLAPWRWNKIHVLRFHLHSWKQWSTPPSPTLPPVSNFPTGLWDYISVSRQHTDLSSLSALLQWTVWMMKHVMIHGIGIGGGQNHRLRWILTAQK